MLEHWALEPQILYLNHGTVGVTPNRVMQVQHELRQEIERQPARFMLRELEHHSSSPALQPSRMRLAVEKVAAFLGANSEDLVFVDNVTTGINAVLRSIKFVEHDEILMADLNYGAVTKTAEYVARNSGAKVVCIAPPFPDTSPEAITEAFSSAINSRTKIVIVDHITASTALVLPIREIALACRAKGVPILVDGAHAPGTLDFNLTELGVDWYSGNLHKWAFAPRGCGILWASKERQKDLHPTVISWGLDQGFTQEFDLVGTKDPTAYLAAPTGIEFMHEIGLNKMRQYNHRLAWAAAQQLADHFGTTFAVPESMVGSMVAVPLPKEAGSSTEAAFALQHKLLYQEKIEVPILEVRGSLYVRISAQVYNQLSDIEHLARVLETYIKD